MVQENFVMRDNAAARKKRRPSRRYDQRLRRMGFKMQALNVPVFTISRKPADAIHRCHNTQQAAAQKRSLGRPADADPRSMLVIADTVPCWYSIGGLPLCYFRSAKFIKMYILSRWTRGHRVIMHFSCRPISPCEPKLTLSTWTAVNCNTRRGEKWLIFLRHSGLLLVVCW